MSYYGNCYDVFYHANCFDKHIPLPAPGPHIKYAYCCFTHKKFVPRYVDTDEAERIYNEVKRIFERYRSGHWEVLENISWDPEVLKSYHKAGGKDWGSHFYRLTRLAARLWDEAGRPALKEWTWEEAISDTSDFSCQRGEPWRT